MRCLSLRLRVCLAAVLSWAILTDIRSGKTRWLPRKTVEIVKLRKEWDFSTSCGSSVGDYIYNTPRLEETASHRACHVRHV